MMADQEELLRLLRAARDDAPDEELIEAMRRVNPAIREEQIPDLIGLLREFARRARELAPECGSLEEFKAAMLGA
jgi:hypothetical protein